MTSKLNCFYGYRNKLDNVADFSEYFELLKSFSKISRYDRSQLIANELFCGFFKFLNRPHLFDNADQLNAVDRLHIELYKQDANLLYSTAAKSKEYK